MGKRICRAFGSRETSGDGEDPVAQADVAAQAAVLRVAVQVVPEASAVPDGVREVQVARDEAALRECRN